MTPAMHMPPPMREEAVTTLEIKRAGRGKLQVRLIAHAEVHSPTVAGGLRARTHQRLAWALANEIANVAEIHRVAIEWVDGHTDVASGARLVADARALSICYRRWLRHGHVAVAFADKRLVVHGADLLPVVPTR